MYLLATLLVHSQYRQDLLAALEHLAAYSRTEPGTLQYEVLTDLENQNRIIVFERYADECSMQAHLNSAPLQALVAQFGDYLSEQPNLVRMTQQTGFLREGLGMGIPGQ
jgi:quinol monooxygenase YgiN